MKRSRPPPSQCGVTEEHCSAVPSARPHNHNDLSGVDIALACSLLIIIFCESVRYIESMLFPVVVVALSLVLSTATAFHVVGFVGGRRSTATSAALFSSSRPDNFDLSGNTWKPTEGRMHVSV